MNTDTSTPSTQHQNPPSHSTPSASHGIALTTIESPLGQLLLAGGSQGLLRVAFEVEGFDRVTHEVLGSLGLSCRADNSGLDPVVTQLEEYFAGRRRHFDIALDWSLSRGFHRQVQQHLMTIDYGKTLSYGELAASVGNPKAVRAVGTACGKNPLPIIAPCHRVLRSDGSIGGYLAGPESKRALLRWESAGSGQL